MHTVSEEQNEVLEQQRYLLERRMYHLDSPPPKLTAQEYIIRYLTEKEDKYLAWYLHNREPAINKIAQAVCERYAMSEHFADIKQAAVFGINGEIEYKPVKPMTFEEISHSASRKSDKASERTYNNALGKMRNAMLSFIELWE